MTMKLSLISSTIIILLSLFPSVLLSFFPSSFSFPVLHTQLIHTPSAVYLPPSFPAATSRHSTLPSSFCPSRNSLLPPTHSLHQPRLRPLSGPESSSGTIASQRMLAHNKPQASTTSELLTPKPHGEHRHTSPQLQAQQQQSTHQPSSSLLPQPHPRQERPKRKISHREPAPSSRTTTADTRLSRVHVDHLETPTNGTSLSHQPKRIDSQEPMTPADSRTHLNGSYLQRPPSFEPFGIHRQDQQQRQERPQRRAASADTESKGRITDNIAVYDQGNDPPHNGADATGSNQYQTNLGPPAKMDHRTKRSPAVVGGATKHGDDRDGRSIASSATTTSRLGRGETEPHQDKHPSQHIQHNTGQPMTIRDIVDSEELRNQLAELHRSLNSNPDPHPPQYTSSAQVQNRLSNKQPSPKYPQALSSTVQTDRTGPRRGMRGDSVASDLTMDTSLLEKRFRARLEADIQVKNNMALCLFCFFVLSLFVVAHRI